MFLLFTLPFIVIISNIIPGAYNLLMWALMGFGMAGIGLSVMHDGNHGAYSKNTFFNKLTGYGLNFVGGYDLCWRIQHNVLHHTYTNIIGMDEDVDAGIVLRFSDSQDLKKHHKYQHLYAWFLYGLMSFSWIMSKDFIQVFKYNKKDLLKSQNITLKKAIINLTLWKLFYFSYIIVLPIFLTPNLGVNIGGF
jgi:linoleoyl-CoA desaturase